jgi:cobalamin biosynthesis protein CobT
MARARRTLDRKTLRDQSDAAERRKKDEDEEVDEEEEEDEDEDEDEGDEDDSDDAEASGDEEDDGGDDDDDDEDRPKKKKKVAKAKPVKVVKTTKSRARTPKVVRMKAMWGVYSNSHQLVEEFEYPKRKDAEELAAKLTADKKSGHPFFLQPIKKPMEKEEKKEKEK